MSSAAFYVDQANRAGELAAATAGHLFSEMPPDGGQAADEVAARLEANGRQLIEAGLRAVQAAEGLRALSR